MMKNKIVIFINTLLLLLLVMTSMSGWAKCKTTGVAQTEDNRTASIPFGRINLYDSYFYPVGSLLASVVVPPTNYTYGGATASSVLWECDASDLSNIYFLVATNGDHWLGGFNEIGAVDGLSGVYATYFANIGLKQTMGGVVLSRYWKKLPISTYATSGNKIQIRLQDIPPMLAELYRVSQLPIKGGNSQYGCTSYLTGSSVGAQYTCNQPNAYIELVGPGLTHDEIGEDSYKNFSFWGVDNGFGYGMKDGSTLYSTSSCVARSATPLVKLPPISMNELNSGLTSTASFNVSVECNNGVASGTGAGQTAIGFQVSSGSYSAAKTLGLVNSSDGVSMLLSDNYNNEEMAKGVGILISYQNSPTTPLTLIGQTDTNLGSNAGWYPVLNNAITADSSKSGYTNYNYNFIATLKTINGKAATVGKVRATATVLVRMQ